MGVQVVEVLGLARIDVARDVQVVIVRTARNLRDGDHAGVAGHLDPVVEDVHDLADILRPESVLVPVLLKPSRGVDHEDPRPGRGVLLVDDDDAGRDTRPVEEVRGQADDALD
ncbi:hypothetical protein DSECCO2_589150 [anaerobic digester metagenome]